MDSQCVDGQTFSRGRMVEAGQIVGGQTSSLWRMVQVERLLVDRHSPYEEWSRLTDC
jgi:hypothetical protein